MPIPMNKTNTAIITSAADTLCRKFHNQRQTIPEEVFYNTFWSVDEQELIAKAIDMLPKQCIDPAYLTQQHDAIYIHGTMPPGVALDHRVTVSYNCRETRLRGVVPKTDTLATTNPAILELVNDTIERMYICSILRRTVDFFTRNCKTVEQVRYMFPPILRLLRMAGQHHMAAEVERVRTPPRNMPSMAPMLRREIKWLNQWFAEQELLGTFNLPTVRQDKGFSVSVSSCTIIRFDPETDEKLVLGLSH